MILEDLDELPPVAADLSQIQIVLRNIIRNAGEAMSGRGRLTITGRAKQTMVEIAVSDNGPGIHPDRISQVMEPFFTTKARGLGLGLAISRMIVEKNQGQINVLSDLGKGSTFLVRLRSATQAQGNSSPTDGVSVRDPDAIRIHHG
jgi:signal transduction histidine kinase